MNLWRAVSLIKDMRGGPSITIKLLLILLRGVKQNKKNL